MHPGHHAGEVLHDRTLRIDQGSDLLGILAWKVGQHPLQVEVGMPLNGIPQWDARWKRLI